MYKADAVCGQYKFRTSFGSQTSSRQSLRHRQPRHSKYGTLPHHQVKGGTHGSQFVVCSFHRYEVCHKYPASAISWEQPSPFEFFVEIPEFMSQVTPVTARVVQRIIDHQPPYLICIWKRPSLRLRPEYHHLKPIVHNCRDPRSCRILSMARTRDHRSAQQSHPYADDSIQSR